MSPPNVTGALSEDEIIAQQQHSGLAGRASMSTIATAATTASTRAALAATRIQSDRQADIETLSSMPLYLPTRDHTTLGKWDTEANIAEYVDLLHLRIEGFLRRVRKKRYSAPYLNWTSHLDIDIRFGEAHTDKEVARARAKCGRDWMRQTAIILSASGKEKDSGLRGHFMQRGLPSIAHRSYVDVDTQVPNTSEHYSDRWVPMHDAKESATHQIIGYRMYPWRPHGEENEWLDFVRPVGRDGKGRDTESAAFSPFTTASGPPTAQREPARWLVLSRNVMSAPPEQPLNWLGGSKSYEQIDGVELVSYNLSRHPLDMKALGSTTQDTLRDHTLRLTYLSLNGMRIGNLPPLLPVLATLVLSNTSLCYLDRISPLCTRFAALRSLAWVRVSDTSPAHFFPHSPAVRLCHLYFFLHRSKHNQYLGKTLPAVAQSLETLTLFGGRDEAEPGLQGRCEQMGVKLEISRRSGELVTDVELWARSQQ
ncbi:hypothetical protein JCM11641_004237 [Rhodosporidiobolus odoratus]